MADFSAFNQPGFQSTAQWMHSYDWQGLGLVEPPNGSYHSGRMPKFAWALMVLQIYLMATQRLLRVILDC